MTREMNVGVRLPKFLQHAVAQSFLADERQRDAHELRHDDGQPLSLAGRKRRVGLREQHSDLVAPPRSHLAPPGVVAGKV